MALLAYNLTGSPVTLAASVTPVVLPPSPNPPNPGPAFNVTSELKGLTSGQYTALAAQATGVVQYVWTTYPEFPIGSLTAAPNSGGTGGGGGPTSNGNVFVYRDSEPSPTANVFATWAGAHAAALASGVPATIVIDDSLNNCSIPEGETSWDMSSITLVGHSSQGYSLLFIYNGNVWTVGTELYLKNNLVILLEFTSNAALCTPTNDGVSVFLENNTVVIVDNQGIYFDASVNDVEVDIHLGDHCEVAGNGGSGHTVYVSDSGGDIGFFFEGLDAYIANDAASGDGSNGTLTVAIIHLSAEANSNYPTTWPFYSGNTPNYDYPDRAENLTPYTGTFPSPNPPNLQGGTMLFGGNTNSAYWWTGSGWSGGFPAEYAQVFASAPQTTGLATGGHVVFDNQAVSVNNTYGGYSSPGRLFISFNPTPYPNLAFKLVGNPGSLFDGNIAYQWWDLTNDVGVGNISGNLGGGIPGDAIAIIPSTYSGGSGGTYFFELRLVFVSGTTFIGENTAGGFILPWVTMESIGSPQ